MPAYAPAFDWAEFHGGTTPPPDVDGDGVADSSDNCPSVANANQSDVDGDGAGDACDGQDNRDSDGVQNYQDNCPNEAGPASNGGCPVAPPADSDGDGVADSSDNCPNEAGPASNNGCPVPPPSNDPFPGIRWFPVLGTYAGADQGWV